MTASETAATIGMHLNSKLNYVDSMTLESKPLIIFVSFLIMSRHIIATARITNPTTVPNILLFIKL